MSGIQNSEPIWLIFICGKLFKKLSPSLFVLCICHPHLSLLCGNFPFLSNVFFFSLLLYFLVEYLFEYSDYFYIYRYILSFFTILYVF